MHTILIIDQGLVQVKGTKGGTLGKGSLLSQRPPLHTAFPDGSWRGSLPPPPPTRLTLFINTCVITWPGTCGGLCLILIFPSSLHSFSFHRAPVMRQTLKTQLTSKEFTVSADD